MLVYHSLHKAAPAQSNSKLPAISQFTFLVKRIDPPSYHSEPTDFSIEDKEEIVNRFGQNPNEKAAHSLFCN